jgi:hypothetical protein
VDPRFDGLDHAAVQSAAEAIGGPDRHAGEAGAPQGRSVPVRGDRAVAALDRWRGPVVGAVTDDVADPHPAARTQHTGDLAEHNLLVGRQNDHAIGDHDVDRFVVEREVLDGALEELDVRRARGMGVAAGQLDRLDVGVHAVDVAGGSDPARRQQGVEAASGAEVEHCLAGLELGDGDRVAAPPARPHGRVRHVADVVVVAGPEW